MPTAKLPKLHRFLVNGIQKRRSRSDRADFTNQIDSRKPEAFIGYSSDTNIDITQSSVSDQKVEHSHQRTQHSNKHSDTYPTIHRANFLRHRITTCAFACAQ